MLSFSNMRKVFLAESEQMFEDESEEGESERNQQGNFLGDSLFQVMVHSDWPQGEATTEETTLLRKLLHLYDRKKVLMFVLVSKRKHAALCIKER